MSALTLVGAGCAGFVGVPGAGAGARFAYFVEPDPMDPWSAKILGWQRRERAELSRSGGVLPSVAGSGEQAAAPTPLGAPVAGGEQPRLRNEYAAFLARQQRATAREFAAWIQAKAKQHYVDDGPIDHWATLEETLAADGDDCDGLELLAFHGLRALGFDEDRVYRAIVHRPSDGQHHMVTLWFEDLDDPWVIDPTGAMTTGMPRMSQMPAWVPLKVFSETREFSVEQAAARLADAR